jgi:hypothetical protein
MKKILDIVLGTFLSWFDNKAFSFVFAMILAAVAFFCADPVDGISQANVAVFAFLVGLMTTALLLFGSSIVMRREYNWPAALCALIGSCVGTVSALLINII